MRRPLAIFAFLAIFSLICMPQGYMPSRSSDGSFILMICDGMKPAPSENPHAMMDHSGHDDHDPNSAQSYEIPCDYAASMGIDLPTNISIGFAQTLFYDRNGLVPAALTGIFPARLPPSTGPPVV